LESALYWSTVLITTLWLVFGFGGSKGHVKINTLASLISFGILVDKDFSHPQMPKEIKDTLKLIL
jgi:hypothetical protein